MTKGKNIRHLGICFVIVLALGILTAPGVAAVDMISVGADADGGQQTGYCDGAVATKCVGAAVLGATVDISTTADVGFFPDPKVEFTASAAGAVGGGAAVAIPTAAISGQAAVEWPDGTDEGHVHCVASSLLSVKGCSASAAAASSDCVSAQAAGHAANAVPPMGISVSAEGGDSDCDTESIQPIPIPEAGNIFETDIQNAHSPAPLGGSQESGDPWVLPTSTDTPQAAFSTSEEEANESATMMMREVPPEVQQQLRDELTQKALHQFWNATSDWPIQDDPLVGQLHRVIEDAIRTEFQTIEGTVLVEPAES